MPPFSQNPEASDRTCGQRVRAMKTGSRRGLAETQWISSSAECSGRISKSSDWDSVSDRRRDASASTGYRPGHIAPLPLQVAAFALRESARIPTSTSRAGFRPGPRIEVLAGDEAGEARWHASALKGVHHVSILVDDGSCDGAGETLRDASDKTSVTF